MKPASKLLPVSACTGWAGRLATSPAAIITATAVEPTTFINGNVATSTLSTLLPHGSHGTGQQVRVNENVDQIAARQLVTRHNVGSTSIRGEVH